MDSTEVDERGRIVIPRGLRKELGLTPGHSVIMERVEGGLLVRPALPMDEALRRLRGAIKGPAPRNSPAPMRLKDIWS